MSLIGTLGIELSCDGGKIVAVRFDAPKPVPLDRLLGGRPTEDIPDIVGTLFPLCGLAQAACAASALEMALAREAPDDVREARAALVAAEALREHVARIAVDWPRVAGEEPDGEAFAAIQRALRELKTALFGEARPFVPGSGARTACGDARPAIARMDSAAANLLFADASDRWSTFSSPAAMEKWAQAGRTPAARLLARLLSPSARLDFADTGEDGTPYGRYWNHPTVAALSAAHGELAARVGARLVEVAALALTLTAFANGGAAPPVISATSDGASVGRTRVDVARGALVHDVRLEDGCVAEYRIAAPTTANFAPGGAAERALLRLSGEGRDDMEWRARLTVLELDPCVAYDMKIV